MIPTSRHQEVDTDKGSSDPADYKGKKLLGDGFSCALSRAQVLVSWDHQIL